MELCSMFCGSLDGRGVWGEWVHVYLWLSAFTIQPETVTTLLISYIPTQNKKLYKPNILPSW